MGKYELNYPPIEVDKFKTTIGDRILVQWEENTNTLAKGKLVRPDTHKKMYYTGIVLRIGPLVKVGWETRTLKGKKCKPQLKVGDRLFFGQFSGFNKFYDPKYGRIAILEESNQDAAFAVIPERVEIDSEENVPGFDEDKRTDFYV